MQVIDQINNDYNQALKSKDELAVLVLRQLKTAFGNAEIANNRQALDEQALIKILRGEVKKRRDSIELYQQGGRAELADKEQQEIDIIKKYLPAELDEAVVKEKIQEVINQIGATGPADTGKVMGAVMKALAGQADGSLVGKLVNETLKQK